MPTLLEALSDGSFDMQNKRDSSSNFAKNLTSLRDQVVNDYTKHKIELNKSICNLAKSKNLNDDQIKRVIEEVNNQVYLIEYSKLKEQPERHVTFDIATFPKVKSMLDGTYKERESNLKMQKSASEYGTFEKVASDESLGDSRNMFNSYSVNKCVLKMEVEEDINKIYMQKIASDISNQYDTLEKLSSELDRKLGTVGAALIKYAQLGYDVNDIYNKVCDKANVSDINSQLIKHAAEERLNDMRETSIIADDFKLKLAREINNDSFGLGEYSLLKKANETNFELPTIIADKVSFKNMNELANAFAGIDKLAYEYSEKKEKYNNALDKVASLGLDAVALDKISKGFFSEVLNVANTEKVANDDSLALRNASKILDNILAKGNKDSKAKEQKDVLSQTKNTLDNKIEEDTFQYNKIYNKATKRIRGFRKPGAKNPVQNKGYNSFNLQ